MRQSKEASQKRSKSWREEKDFVKEEIKVGRKE